MFGENDEETASDNDMEKDKLSSLELLQEATGIRIDDSRILEWKEKERGCSNLSSEEIQMALLYNIITLEQSRWVKRGDLPREAMDAAGAFAHSTSNAVAEIIVNGRIKQSLNDIVLAREKLSEVMRRNNIQDTNNIAEIKPEPNILSFENLVNQDINRSFLDNPMLIVGLTTHGNIPAYVISKLLYRKGIVSSVAFMRPTTRGGGSSIQIIEDDETKMNEAILRGSRILVVDDSIDKGESMEQSLNYLEEEYPGQEKTVCVAVSAKVPFLKEIAGEKYETVEHGGKIIYTSASFFRPNDGRY